MATLNLDCLFLRTKTTMGYQLLVGLVVIDAEFGREDHDSIPTTMIKRKLKPLNIRTDL
jgi:hypothetical protein